MNTIDKSVETNLPIKEISISILEITLSEDIKQFEKLCDKYQKHLLQNEHFVELFLDIIKNNSALLNKLWNYVNSKYEEIINDMIIELWDPIYVGKVKNRTFAGNSNDELFKNSDISISVSDIIAPRQTWLKFMK